MENCTLLHLAKKRRENRRVNKKEVLRYAGKYFTRLVNNSYLSVKG